MMNPSDSLVDWVLKTVPTMGAGWCPPGMLGIGIGGTAEKAMLLAKQSLMEDIDMAELKARGPKNKTEELRIELCDKVNALGIGAQGLGGLTTVLDVKIAMAPTHAASKPVAMIPNCAATRHAHFVLDGSGPPTSTRRRSTSGPTCTGRPTTSARRASISTGSRASRSRAGSRATPCSSPARCSPARRGAQAHPGHAGQGREAAGRLSPAASSTTSARSTRCATRSSAPPARPPATRMDKFTEMMLAETGLFAMIGKAERGPAAIEAIRSTRAPT
jgi:fumarate hydratase class I